MNGSGLDTQWQEEKATYHFFNFPVIVANDDNINILGSNPLIPMMTSKIQLSRAPYVIGSAICAIFYMSWLDTQTSARWSISLPRNHLDCVSWGQYAKMWRHSYEIWLNVHSA